MTANARRPPRGIVGGRAARPPAAPAHGGRSRLPSYRGLAPRAGHAGSLAKRGASEAAGPRCMVGRGTCPAAAASEREREGGGRRRRPPTGPDSGPARPPAQRCGAGAAPPPREQRRGQSGEREPSPAQPWATRDGQEPVTGGARGGRGLGAGGASSGPAGLSGRGAIAGGRQAGRQALARWSSRAAVGALLPRRRASTRLLDLPVAPAAAVELWARLGPDRGRRRADARRSPEQEQAGRGGAARAPSQLPSGPPRHRCRRGLAAPVVLLPVGGLAAAGLPLVTPGLCFPVEPEGQSTSTGVLRLEGQAGCWGGRTDRRVYLRTCRRQEHGGWA